MQPFYMRNQTLCHCTSPPVRKASFSGRTPGCSGSIAPRGEAAEFWQRTRSSDEDIVAKSLTVLVLLGGRSGSLFGSTVGSPGMKPKMLHQAYKQMISSSFNADGN